MKISHNKHLAIKAPSVGWFALNFAQTLIGRTTQLATVLWKRDCIWSRYARLCVFTTMGWKSLFYISGILWTIKFLLITSCQEGPEMLPAKFGANWSNCLGGVWKSKFYICGDFSNGKIPQKLAWPTPHNSAELREHVDIGFNNVQHVMWELWAKSAFALKIAPPAVHFWCVSHRGHSIAPQWISFP